jgi:hypothetical protein
MADKVEKRNASRGKIIKEGGYQPTSDPMPVPTSMIQQPSTPRPAPPAPKQSKK